MNGRYFSGRRLECFYYDGKTNYDRKVSLEEEEKRIIRRRIIRKQRSRREEKNKKKK